MKNYLIIIGLVLTTGTVCAYEKVYLQRYPVQNTIYRNTYNPYGYNSYRYYTPAQYARMNANNIRRIQRAQRIRRMNRIRRNMYGNFLTWNKQDKGTLTGYSVPVGQDVYEQMGIAPYNKKQAQKAAKSPTCNTDLFSSPSGDEMYYRNGEMRKDISGATGKTGVTIIYD